MIIVAVAGEYVYVSFSVLAWSRGTLPPRRWFS